MGYEPLHHKYRPQRFSEVVGQEPIVATLTNAIQSGRIANAYLFTGSRGTGKTTTARLMAKALNCLQGPTPEPCGICEMCRAVTTGSALDVIEIDAASNTGVDNIRELIERAQFAPVQSRNKIYIIDEVHMLSSAAFNCLLKTLEEPPKQVTFILATTDPQKVLPTVISRCQRFDFRRIPLQAMVDHLKMISQKEGILIDDQALELISQIAQGGLRDAESLLDQLALLEGQIVPERVWQLVGAVPERELLALCESIQSGQSTQVLEQVRHLLDSGKEALQVLQDLIAFYRDLLIAYTAPDRRDLVAITAPTWQQMIVRAKSYSIGQILTLQERLRMAEPQIKGTTQPRLWLEVALLGLLQPASLSNGVATQNAVVPHGTPVASPRPAYEPPKSPPTADPRMETPKSYEQSGSQPRSEAPKPYEQPPTLAPQNQLPAEVHPLAQSPPPPPIQAPAVPSLPPEPAPSGGLRERWEEWIRSLDPPTQGLMRIAFLINETQKEIVLGFPTETFVKKSNEPKRLKNVQDNLHRLLGRPVLVKFAVGKGKSPTANPPGQDPPQTQNPPPPTQNFQPPPPPPQNPPPTQNFQPLTQNPSPPNQGFQPPQNFQPPSPPPPPQNFQPPQSPPIPPAQNFQPPPPPPQHFQSLPPAQNVPPPPAPNERQPIADPDELERTTKGLADFFNGQVIRWDHDVAAPSDSPGAPAPPPADLADEDDDDIPF